MCCWFFPCTKVEYSIDSGWAIEPNDRQAAAKSTAAAANAGAHTSGAPHASTASLGSSKNGNAGSSGGGANNHNNNYHHHNNGQAANGSYLNLNNQVKFIFYKDIPKALRLKRHFRSNIDIVPLC